MLNETKNNTNRLANEKSPYLLQHAHNPVDWHPWGEEAFNKAKTEDKPVFLSIGYSTCHWCHVMERESFEDNEVAEVLNKNFISIKVDREERPDIDNIYMTVCQILTGQGGWPLSVFLTPDKKPFYAGTYFPKESRMGMPGFISLLLDIRKVWDGNRNSVLSSSEEITKALGQDMSIKGNMPDKNLINKAFSQFKGNFDFVYGGFGNAPKFPSPHNLLFLMRYYHVTKDETALSMVKQTLYAMYKGGIYDHIGSGFCRYSTDRKWFAPHFEKMLYDNAMLSIAYLEGYQITKDKLFLDIATDVLDYIIRDMTSPEGGFYSAEDADSEGVEGKFYLWTPDEVKKILGKEEGEKFCGIYDITEKENFEGGNIPNLLNSGDLGTDDEFIKSCKKKLFEYREGRVHPFKDDKVITSWNGLMIAAMSLAGRVTGEAKYTDTAKKAVDFILKNLVQNGRLMSSYRDGTSKNLGFADDYSFLIWGLIDLFETTFEPFYLQKALDFNSDLLKYFWDEDGGGLFIYGSDSEEQITRPKEFFDSAIPSGNSVAALNFLRLSRLSDNLGLEEKAYKQFQAFGKSLSSSPIAHAFLLSAFVFAMNKSTEIILVGDNTSEMLNIINSGFRPFTQTIMVTPVNIEELSKIMPSIINYKPQNNMPTAYVCENYKCNPPITDIEEFKEMLDSKKG